MNTNSTAVTAAKVPDFIHHVRLTKGLNCARFATVVAFREGDNFTFAVTICNAQDTFCKKEGVKQAMKKLEINPIIIVKNNDMDARSWFVQMAKVLGGGFITRRINLKKKLNHEHTHTTPGTVAEVELTPTDSCSI